MATGSLMILSGPMLGLDLSVWLALLLSLASVILCVVYGLVRWNADADRVWRPPGPAQTITEGRAEKDRQD